MNTTARKNEKTIEKASPYLINNTYAVIIANLARSIGPFDEKLELEAYRSRKETEKAMEAGISSPDLGSNKKQTEMSPVSKDRERVATASSYVREGTAPMLTPPAFDTDGAIFERLIIIIPYKSPDMVK